MNKSVERTMAILTFVAENDDRNGVGISKVSHAFGIPKSSASDVLYSLYELGYLAFANEQMKTFRLGNMAIRLGLSTIRQYNLAAVARPVMERLQRETGYTVFLGVETEEGTVAYLEKAEGGKTLRIADGVGSKKPMHLTAIGKMLLSEKTDEEVLALMKDTCYAVHTQNSIRTPRQLLAQMKLIRERGYAIENFEENDYIYSIAAPVRDASGKAVAAMAVSLILADIRSEAIPNLTDAICKAADELSHILGGK